MALILAEDDKLAPEDLAKVKAILEQVAGLDYETADFFLRAARQGLRSAAIVFPEKMNPGSVLNT